MSAAHRRATYDDLIAVPDNLVAELIDGELFTSPRPATPHARAASAIGSLARTVEVYRLESDRWAVAGTHGGDEALRPEPFEVVALEMGRWWLPEAVVQA